MENVFVKWAKNRDESTCIEKKSRKKRFVIKGMSVFE